jgi:hypothetical protein
MKKRYIRFGSPPKDSYIYHKIMKLVDILSEIKINRPKVFRFETIRKFGDPLLKAGNLYLNGKLLSKEAIHFPTNSQMNVFKSGTIYFYLPTEQYELIKDQLDSYDVQTEENIFKAITSCIVSDDKVTIVDNIKEIKVLPPNKHFTFNDDKAYRIVGGQYKVVGEDEDDYKLQNIKTKEIVFVSKHYAKTNNISEIKVLSPPSLRFEITGKNKDSKILRNEFFGKLYLYDELLDDMAFLSLNKSLVAGIYKGVYNKIKDKLPPHEITDVFANDTMVEILFDDTKNIKIVDRRDSLKEIKVLSPNSFRVEVYPNDEESEGYYTAKSYFNNILLDDDVAVNTEEGYIYFHIPMKIYNTIKNQLPPHITGRVKYYEQTDLITIIIKDLNKVNIIYKEDPLSEIKVNTPGLLSTLKNYQRQILSSDDVDFKKQLVLKGAELVLPIFEEKHPNDNIPRKAIETAKAYLLNPTEENKEIARAASDSTAYSWDSESYTSSWYAAYAAIYANELVLDDFDDTYARSSITNAIIAAHLNSGVIPIDEIKVLSPTPRFTDNEQLSLYLEENPKFRETLVDKIVKDFGSKPYYTLTEEQWLDIIQDWKTKSNGIKYERYIDEIILNSELDINLYISLDPMDDSEGEIVFGTNTFNYNII